MSRTRFDAFVVETRGELIGYLRQMLRSGDDAREVSQDAYLKVFIALLKNPNRDHNPKALLYTTARNLAISRLRHENIVEKSAMAVSVSQELQSDGRCPEHHASKGDELRRLLLVINQLAPKCRKVMLLRMVDGLSQKEIAARLEIAISTVEKHLARGLYNCRKAMCELDRAAKPAPDDQSAFKNISARATS